MKKYRYVFIDAQILITTGVYAIMSETTDGKINEQSLLRMFLYSIFKINREVDCGRIFLVWDKAPYHKSDILAKIIGHDDYKADRNYKTYEDLEAVRKRIEDLDNEATKLIEDPITNAKRLTEINELITKLNEEASAIDIQVTNFMTRSNVKYKIIRELSKFGYTSIIKNGWECDDICTLLSEYCNTNKIPALLVSKDSDYDFMLNKYVDKYNHLKKVTNFEDKFTTEEKVRESNKWLQCFGDIPLYKAKAIFDSCYGSHNALHRTLKVGINGDLVELIKDESNFEDFERYKAQMETFDFTKYPDYDFIKDCLPWYTKQGTVSDLKEFCEFIKNNKINMNPMKYLESVIKQVDLELFEKE